MTIAAAALLASLAATLGLLLFPPRRQPKLRKASFGDRIAAALA